MLPMSLPFGFLGTNFSLIQSFLVESQTRGDAANANADLATDNANLACADDDDADAVDLADTDAVSG